LPTNSLRYRQSPAVAIVPPLSVTRPPSRRADALASSHLISASFFIHLFSSEAGGGVQQLLGRRHLFVAGVGPLFLRGGRRLLLAFDLEHVPPLGQQAFVEEDGRQPGEEQDGQQRDDHDGGAEGEVLDQVSLLVHAAAGEADGGREADEGLAAQQPQDDAHQVAQRRPVAVGDLEEEDADQLGEHDGVGHVHAHQPEDQDAVVQEGEGGAGQAHHHHGDTDHPLHLTVGRLQERSRNTRQSSGLMIITSVWSETSWLNLRDMERVVPHQ